MNAAEGTPAAAATLPQAAAVPRRGWGARAVDAVAAVAAGALLFASFPPRTLWFLAPLGIALLVLVLQRWGAGGARVRSGFGYGLLAGLGLFVPLLPWIGVYVGALPWLALAATCALYCGLFGAGTVFVGRLGTPWLLPLTVAAWWSLAEWLRSAFPFGGFPWGRLAFGQPEGPLLALAGLGGAPLLSFAVALVGAGLAVLLTSLRRRDLTGIVAGALAALLPFGLAVAAPGAPAAEESITVAAIQGSVPRLGLDFNSQRRAVLDNHVARTLELAADVAAGAAPQPDVVVWPENSSDIDPLRNPDAAEQIERAAAAIKAPILVGAVLSNGDGTGSNTVLVWEESRGPSDRHDKTIIQPFGEYLPLRGFFRLFSSYADRAGHFVPGNSDWVVDADGVQVGVTTCYEVAFDRAARTAVQAGAQFLTVPTNNATFGDTEMTYQQLAMSQVRAVEHGRTVVVAATSGVSAIIEPDGRISQHTELFVPAVLTSSVGLRTELTLATTLGPWPERALVTLALVAGFAAYVASAGTRRTPARR